MKAHISSISFATVALSALFAIAPTAKAARITLDGYANYQLSNYERYYSRGRNQQGRYRNLGADYYRNSNTRIDAITNRSRNKSGSLSFEFWAMPFYGANSGTVLTTSGTGRISGFKSRNRVSKRGSAISLNRYAFPEINIWEYTRRGWRFRDAVSFSRRDLL